MTCLSTLETRKEQLEKGLRIRDFTADKLNNSKGCGGVMRVAPLGLAMRSGNLNWLDMQGAQLAAITHSHPLGYLPAAVLTHILNRLVCTEGEPDLKAMIREARDAVAALFPNEPYMDSLSHILNAAINLSENDCSDLENIHLLGEGWVAEEALAISLYCCLRYRKDFSRAIIAAVNHNGDSDSTGAITGNILGALVGYRAIEQKWKTSLELHDLILDIADRLYHDFL
jgi:ADP-ribosylglycohydrolase